MKAPILLCVALLSGHSHDLAPKHEQGQVRRTSYSFEARRSLTGRSSIVNGEEHPGREGVRQEQTYSAKGVLVDRTVRVDDSTLMVFDREYEELELNLSVEVDDPFGADTDEEVSGESDLEGATVRFTREDDEFAAEFPEGEAGDEELLDGLTAEFPWADYLPEEDVDEKDGWEIAPEVLFRTFDLGGDMSLRTDDEGPLDSAMKEVSADSDGDYGGDMSATLVSVSEVDGRVQAEISIEVDVFLLQDRTEITRAQMAEEPDDLPEGMAVPELHSMEEETLYEGEGTLIWDVEGGYLVSLELELEFEATQTLQLSLELAGQSLEIERITTFEGDRSISIEVQVESN